MHWKVELVWRMVDVSVAYKKTTAKGKRKIVKRIIMEKKEPYH